MSKLVERQESSFVETTNGGMRYLAPAKFYAPDGKQLIPEGLAFSAQHLGCVSSLWIDERCPITRSNRALDKRDVLLCLRDYFELYIPLKAKQ